MSTRAGARTGGRAPWRCPRKRSWAPGMTPAQWYCLLAGISLLLAGILGFIADATFDTAGGSDPEGGNVGGALQGDSFLGFEVNGWHNYVHILSGLLLLAAFRRRGPAKTVALAFGVVYGLVAIIGLIDGNDVLGVIPVNPADNILHIALSALGILTGLMSRGNRRNWVPQPRRRDPEAGRRRSRPRRSPRGRPLALASESGPRGVTLPRRRERPNRHPCASALSPAGPSPVDRALAENCNGHAIIVRPTTPTPTRSFNSAPAAPVPCQ